MPPSELEKTLRDMDTAADPSVTRGKGTAGGLVPPRAAFMSASSEAALIIAALTLAGLLAAGILWWVR